MPLSLHLLSIAGQLFGSQNDSFFSSSADKLASDGALKVNEHLQVEGYDNIYAIGDCAHVTEPKMAYHAGLHANVVVTNIINSLTQKPLKTYKPGKMSCKTM